MTDQEPDDEVTVDEAGEVLEGAYQDLIDENTEMFRAARESAISLFKVADRHEEMAALARESATLHLILAKMSGSSLADLLEGQFNLTVEEEPVVAEGDDDDEEEQLQ